MKSILFLILSALFIAANSNASTMLTETACEKEGEIKALWGQYNCQVNHESTSCKEVKKIRAKANLEMGVSIRSACAKGRFSKNRSVRDKANAAHKNGTTKIASN